MQQRTSHALNSLLSIPLWTGLTDGTPVMARPLLSIRLATLRALRADVDCLQERSARLQWWCRRCDAAASAGTAADICVQLQDGQGKGERQEVGIPESAHGWLCVLYNEIDMLTPCRISSGACLDHDMAILTWQG